MMKDFRESFEKGFLKIDFYRRRSSQNRCAKWDKGSEYEIGMVWNRGLFFKQSIAF